jgi:hypothetical protein
VNIVPFEHQLQIAGAIVKSGLFGLKTIDQAIALMALCEADGLHPAKAAQEYSIIQGRPALKSDAMLARFHRAGGTVKWITYTDQCVVGEFSHPQAGAVKIEWTIEMAARIGLASKDNWRNYPRQMLRARCISEGVRTCYPGCITGQYAVEEVQDFDTPNKPPVQRDMGPVEVVIEPGNQDGALPLFVPGSEEAYAAYNNKGEWMEGYLTMVGKICGSGKLNSLQKREKVQSLWEINREYLDSLSNIEKARMRSAIVELGGTAEVKPEAALDEPTAPF